MSRFYQTINERGDDSSRESEKFYLIKKLKVRLFEGLYGYHTRVRYLHDVTYSRGGWYKSWTDKPVSNAVHRASIIAFVISFVVFQTIQNLWPYMFTFKPREVQAGQSQVSWSSQNDFTSNAVTGGTAGVDGIWDTADDTIRTTRSQVDTSTSSGDVKIKSPDGTGNDGAITFGSNFNINSGMTESRTQPDGFATTLSAVVSQGANSITVASSPSGAFAAGDELLIARVQDTTPKWETVRIASGYTTGNTTISLASAIVSSGGFASGTLVQRIPNYSSITINNGVTLNANTWDGSTGGVVMFRVSGTLTNNGTIDATGLMNVTNASTSTYGGGYGGTGGGSGGGPSYGLADNPMLLGRAGGGDPGKYGGGIIYINANQVINNGFIKSNGTGGGDHNKGAGSGGSIYLKVSSSVSGASNIEARGGSNPYSFALGGNGGGGGGGRIRIESSPVLSSGPNVSGGSGSWNGSPGQPGTTSFASSVPYLNPGTMSGLKINAGDGTKNKWSSISWASTALPASTTIKFQARTSDDNSTWSDPTWASTGWTQSTQGSTSMASQSISSLSSSQYLELKLTLTSSDGIYTPTLNDFTVVYDSLEAPVNGSTTMYKSDDGTTLLKNSSGANVTAGTEGGYTSESSVKVSATGLTCTNCGTSNQRKIEVEVKPVASAFDGTGLVQGDYNDTTFASTATISGLTVGASYHTRSRTIDAQGRVSGWTSYGTGSDTPTAAADFSIEQTPPTGTVSINETISGYVNNNLVTLTLSASDTGGSGMGTTEGMRFSNDPSTGSGQAWSDWEAYAATRANWNVTSGYGATAGDGSKTVYAQFRDNAGNVGAIAGGPWIQTTDAEFNTGTKTGVTVANDSVKLSLSSNWIDGLASTPLEGKQVYNVDVSGTKAWKTTNTACVGPQCATGLDPNHPSNYSLVADNTVDFSLYPARDACKAIGGRLPNMQELLSIHANKASYGNNFQSYYWAATEYDSLQAREVNLTNGNPGSIYKADPYYVRCVRPAGPSNWIDGLASTPLEGKQVYNVDISGTKAWKTTNTACVGPQCATGLDPDYPSNYSLVADNTVDFSLYPARDACKAIDGRLPTMQELLSIYTNKASYGNNFQSYYWSATEYDSLQAREVNLTNGNPSTIYKADPYYVRCVRPTVYLSSGSLVSNSITPSGLLASWGTLNYTKSDASNGGPAGTAITVDVLDGNGSPISGYSNLSNGASLSNLSVSTYPTIKLKANLSTSISTNTPTLADWQVGHNIPATDTITLDTTAPIVPRDNISDPASFPANNTLRVPNGGESWGGGTLKTIVWNKDNVSDGTGAGLHATPVNLYYSGTGTAPWVAIASNLTNGANSANGGCTPDAGTGCYNWRLPNTVDSTNMKVKIEFVDAVGNKVDYNNDSAANADTSDTVFSSTSDISPPTAFTISGSSPDNNDWTDATPDISWSASSDPESGPVTYELWMTQTASPAYPDDFTKRTDVGSAGTINVTNATPTLTGLEGTWYYFVRAVNGAYDPADPLTYRDVGYGISGDTTHYFRVDDTKPTGTVTIQATLSSETDATNSYLVDLALAQSDGSGSGTSLVQFSNDNVFYCNFASYATPKANFDLRDNCAGGTTLTSRGTRTVYMKLKDAAGNTSDVISDTIIYDITNPNIPASVASSVQGTVVSGSTNTIRVTWTDITDPAEAAETVSGIDGYNIYRSDSFNASYTKINGSIIAPAVQLYNDSTTSDGRTYNYKVEAVDNAGNTNTNNTATSQSLADKTAPSDVSSFAAGGTNDTTIGLTWNSTADNGAANNGKANKYYVERTAALGGTEPTLPGSDPSFTYSALTTVNFEQAGKYNSGSDTYSHNDTVIAQSWYFYRVKAEDSASPTPYLSANWIYFKSRGNFAPVFNQSDIVVTANNGHTQNTAAPGDIINFTFPITDADGFNDLNAGTGNALETIRVVDPLSVEQLAATQVTSRVQDIANGYTFTYNYTVPSTAPYGTYTTTLRVKDSVGVDGSTHDISRNVNFKVIPEKPTAVTVTGTNSTTLNITWTAPGNAGNRTGIRGTNTYSVRRADTSGGTYSHIGYSTTTSYSDSGLTMNQTYYYKVVGFDVSNNEGVISDVGANSGATTPTPAIPLDSSVKMIDASTVEENQNRFALVWSDPQADTANNTVTASFSTYVIERAENCVPASCVYSPVSGVTNGETANKYYVDINLSNTTDYVYRVRVKDTFGNLSRTDLSPVRQGKPGAKPSISVTAETAGVSTATIKWTATQDAETVVYYGTSAGNYSKMAGVPDRRTAGTEHNVGLTGLTPNTTYYYKIVSKNILGFANDFVEDSFRTTDFNISDTSVTTTTTTATVRWTTNIDSDSNVEYKKETKVGEAAEDSQTAGDPKLTTSHEVVIKALKPDTNYTYKIRSVTGDKYISETAFLTFKTKPYDASQFVISPNASSIAEQNITATSAKITWNTAVATTSWLDYGTSSGNYTMAAGNDAFSTVHVIELVNLTPGNTYYYKVRGKDTNDIEYTSQEYSFTAVLLPKISNAKVIDLGHYSVTVSFDTNVDVSSFVAYGKDASYGAGVGKTEFVRNHSTKIENLEDNTTYHYQISVKDKLGNEEKTADLTFTTPLDTAGPEIKEVKIDILPMGNDDETASAIISWTTNKQATTKIEYDEGVIGGTYSKKTTEDSTLNSSHTVIVKELNPSSTYHFRIVSKDKRGNSTNSQDYTFVTPTKEKSILQLIIRSLEETFSWVKELPKFFRGIGKRITGR